MIVKIRFKMIMGEIIGNVIFQNVSHPVAPSIFAASYIESAMVCSPARKIMICMPDFHINVNLSVVQLLQKDIVDTVAKVLKKTGVNPRNIVLEITESFAINDMDRVLNIINGIRELGPKIALDDFGTGYSSLNYIKQLPFDIIKVDKTFIDDITEDEYAQAFIKLIVELSATIGTKIVVEGVEDKSQLDILRELGVDFIQGYYYGKPEPAYEFERLNFKGRINI